MDLRHLRYFVAVAEELHFGRAAARLHIAQPPLSRQIRDLEEELGVVLFERDRRRVALTQAGTVFLDEARKVLAQLEEGIVAARRAQRGEVGILRIGYVGSVAYSGLPEIVRHFRSRRPSVDVRVLEMTPAAQISAILAGGLDVGFLRAPVDEPGLAVQVVLDEELMAALPSGHPLAHRKTLTLASLAREPFVLTARARGSGYHDHILTTCRSAGFSPRVVHEGSHFDVLCLVAAGSGVSVIPASLREIRRGDVLYRSLQERPRTQLVMVSRQDATSPVLRELVEDVRRLGRRGIQRQRRRG